MRYTTIIDIRDVPEIYRNINTRLVYLHLCLCSGYHEQDRDKVTLSIRGIAAASGLTLSAVRNAMHVLSKYGLLRRQGDALTVAKWVIPDDFATKPPRTKRDAALDAAAQERRRQEQEEQARKRSEEEERKRRLANTYKYVDTASVDDLKKWAAELAAAKPFRPVWRGDAVLQNTEQARAWLDKEIAKKVSDKEIN